MRPSTEVRLIASSGYPHDVAIAARGCAWLKQHGYHVNNPDILARRYLRFGGTDVERLADLHAIGTGAPGELTLAVRGGYGLARLLDKIDFARIAEQARASGTPIVGHSDFTAFQLAYLAATGGVTFAGPMLLADFGEEHVDPFMWTHFEAILRDPACRIEVAAPQVAAARTVEGTLWGGNLAMLCSLLGTPYMPKVAGGILFLEDINEPPYRVERMLLQLLQAGVLASQQAIVMGDFSNYRTTDYDNGYDMAAVFDYLREQLDIPVLTGLPFGHCPRKLTLPVGAQARLESGGDGFTLALSGYPTLSPASAG
ncbi:MULTISPECIES: muramoyltetrapeptide carboxypeptidase [unclassified Cupriavidus]|uniref:muramoyltetrapeptide carboxypeptidase n=1 Tax=unclassified Cupriavidus TaxID=2640874 RepID=UPI001BFFF4CE|nr:MULTISPECIES: muramoyltetrapeptide carboxypeptidase [unclassified Cupriavidus]MCA3189663.1 muramoyltetrapeptide carboxypeptidase [Cupriavidus sp.]MCA3195699.1 muramoyltetrapeptide carboxypeptidase [Cupriavidus sp.]MCA3203856.1 muramoyltetrapeptide carboxypeptidase [Cupriavidus sp.]MCA3209453.1 muramoyltetrapeptide carboxypeptidase [Cupriavidus sp.]MCA3234637.1 muramoyltetrapeptide carboxypeptidase [Cupriavidus sp.]